MNRYELLRRAAADEGVPREEADQFAEQLRFAVWLGYAAPGDQVVGWSEGAATLPAGAEWPTSRTGSPLPFTASADCALLPRAEGLTLPDDGSLVFFLDPEGDLNAQPGMTAPEFARVLHVPAEVGAVSPGEDSTALTAWVEPVLPEWIEDREGTDEVEHVDRLCDLVEKLWPEQDRGLALRIGGYTRRKRGQDTPWTQMAKLNLRDRLSDPDLPRPERFRLRREEEQRLLRDWVPLAQFHTGSDYYHGCFLISSDDLAARRFDGMRSFTIFTE